MKSASFCETLDRLGVEYLRPRVDEGWCRCCDRVNRVRFSV